jgi:kumamolisin
MSFALSKVIVRNPRSCNFRGPCVAFLVAVGLTAASAAPTPALSGVRNYFNGSIKALDSDPSVQVVRQTLTAAENNEILQVCISLKMPNFAELENRVANGEQIPHDAMEARYLPSASDYAALETWLKGQGFILTQVDPNHTNIFASATIAQIEHSLGANFVRVATADGQFSSAINAPNLPAELSGAVLSIDGLQPHLRLHHSNGPQPSFKTVSGTQYVAPADILAAYNAPNTLTGTGQTIAIIMDANVLTSDLSLFISTVGSTAKTSNFTIVPVNGGSTLHTDDDEAAMDVEWTSTIAPAAQIRLYSIPALTFSSIIAACSQVLADAPANHITALSISAAGVESQAPSSSTLTSNSQVFAQLAAAGVTVLFASGDGGSNPNLSGSVGYNSSNPLQAEYPASDPNVTGVGGTSLVLAQGTFSYASETPFFILTSATAGGGTGGGISTLFSRPSWQTDGGSILTNTNRCVPDVSIVWGSYLQGNSTEYPPLIILNGSAIPGGGTSFSVQVWGGVVALLNQARANVGQSPIGLLGPLVYPLHGTSAFNDITSGGNGFYNAGIGYDLCSGLGTPNIANLAADLSATTPVILSQPGSFSVSAGSSFLISVTAIGSGTLAYQWSKDGTAITGATSSTYFVASATAANAGSYTVVVSNILGSVTSSAAVVTVNPASSSTPTGNQPSSYQNSYGGGGAPSYWFYLALAVLLAIRKVRGTRETETG